MKRMFLLVVGAVVFLSLSTVSFASPLASPPRAKASKDHYSKAQLRKIRQFHFELDQTISKAFQKAGAEVRGRSIFYQKKALVTVSREEILSLGLLKAVLSLRADRYLVLTMVCKNPEDNASIEIDIKTGAYRLLGSDGNPVVPVLKTLEKKIDA